MSAKAGAAYPAGAPETFPCSFCGVKQPMRAFPPGIIRAFMNSAGLAGGRAEPGVRMECASCFRAAEEMRMQKLGKQKGATLAVGHDLDPLTRLEASAVPTPSDFPEQVCSAWLKTADADGTPEKGVTWHFKNDGRCYTSLYEKQSRKVAQGTFEILSGNAMCKLFDATCERKLLRKDSVQTFTFKVDPATQKIDCFATMPPGAWITKVIILQTIRSLRLKVRQPPPLFLPQRRTCWAHGDNFVTHDETVTFRPSGKFDRYVCNSVCRDSSLAKTYGGVYTVAPDGKSVTAEYVESDDSSILNAPRLVQTSTWAIDPSTCEVRCLTSDGTEGAGHFYFEEPLQFATEWLGPSAASPSTAR